MEIVALGDQGYPLKIFDSAQDYCEKARPVTSCPTSPFAPSAQRIGKGNRNQPASARTAWGIREDCVNSAEFSHDLLNSKEPRAWDRQRFHRAFRFMKGNVTHGSTHHSPYFARSATVTFACTALQYDICVHQTPINLADCANSNNRWHVNLRGLYVIRKR